MIDDLFEAIAFDDTSAADDGQTVLPMLESGEFELLTADRNMFRMTGLELLKAVRAQPSLSYLPAFMVTAGAKRDQMVEAAHEGVNGDIFFKPLIVQTMKEELDKVLDPTESPA